MKFKAIIFDMDGTIIDTEHIWKQAMTDLITSRGIAYQDAPDCPLKKQLHGLGLRESCTILKNTFSFTDPIEKLVQEKSNRAVSLYRKKVTFIDGFETFHNQVQTFNLKNGIATNADDATVQATNEALQLNKFFGEHIYAISQVNNICKPNPAIYLYAAQKLVINPQECIAVEDSEHGLNAAKAAGMFAIGINTSKNRINLKKADLIIDSYDELNLGDLL